MSGEDKGEELAENMDKRNQSRTSSVPPNADCKKDNGNGNNKSRHNRKKDNNNGGNGNGRGPRSDYGSSGRKPMPQRNRGYDKRPRARGDYSGGQREEVAQAEGPGSEYGSVQDWGSKKSNLNHLLNFHFEPRDPYSCDGAGRRGGDGRVYRGRAGQASRRRDGISYNKERFLQANCQFIVREQEDYTLHSVDPDTLVDWDLIEQVRLFTPEEACCPICLYPPTAAKITRCGHIYCWTCILHYLSLDDKTWRKCPICYESVHSSDLKSVKTQLAHQYRVGEQITLRLMQKPRGSTTVAPKACWDPERDSCKPYKLADALETRYSKLLLASPAEVQEILKTEQTALETQLAVEADENSLEASFIKAALKLAEERQTSQNVKKGASSEEKKMIEKAAVEEKKEPTEEKPASYQGKQDAVAYTSAFDDQLELPPPMKEDLLPRQHSTSSFCSEASDGFDIGLDELEVTTVTEEQDVAMAIELVASGDTDEQVGKADEGRDNLSAGLPVIRSKPVSDAYFFYQAEDGQHIYIHPVNARCLVREYGGLEYSPDTITATIVELEPVSMDEDLRRRLRYLSHLPLTCEFQVAELALKPPVLSTDTLRLFADEIERRRKMRQRKQRDERRRDRRIREDENRRYGIDPTVKIVKSDAPVYSQHRGVMYPQVPVTQPEPTPTTSVHKLDSTESTPYGSPMSEHQPSTSPTPSVASSDDGGQTSSLSFAQMLRQGKARPSEQPANKPTPTTSTNKPPGDKGSDSEGEVEGHVAAPTFQTSFGDAIQEALDSFVKSPGKQEGVAAEVTMSASGAGGKKKKKPIKLLFTTTMNRAK